MNMNRRPIAQVNAMYLIVMLSALCFASPAGGEDVKPVSRTGDAPMQCMLFFDDWMLQTRQGLDRVQGQPKLLADVTPPLPEHLSRIAVAMASVSAFFDERVGRYVIYLDCWTPAPESKRFSVRVESDDPAHWPDLHGERAAEVLRLDGESVVRDEDANPLSRFIIRPLTGSPLADKGYVGMFEQRVAFSADGVNFKMAAAPRWIRHTDEPGFGMVYDPWLKRFIIFGRVYGVDRRVGRVITTDFKTFGVPEINLQPDALDPVGREFYEKYSTRYEDMFVGCLLIFDTEPSEMRPLKMQGSIGTQLAYSYNGEHWYRSFRDRMFIDRGAAGSPTGGMAYAGTPIRAPDDRVIVPAMGAWGGHTTVVEDEQWQHGFERMLFYELRLDGFAYLKTSSRHGMIRTKALVVEGDELTLNVRTNLAGYAKVQLLDGSTFKPLPNYTLEKAIPINGDHLFAKAQWQDRDNIAELKGRPVVVEVYVREGELFALRLAYKAFYTSWLGHRL